jgi:N-methylhydantoinase B/oxoprolinase/acetone carboxylase alpha subunit
MEVSPLSLGAAIGQKRKDRLVEFAYRLDDCNYEVTVGRGAMSWQMTISGVFPSGSVNYPAASGDLLVETIRCYTFGINDTAPLNWTGNRKYTDVAIEEGTIVNNSAHVFRLVQAFVTASSELR